jgi:hypothetical protein
MSIVIMICSIPSFKSRHEKARMKVHESRFSSKSLEFAFFFPDNLQKFFFFDHSWEFSLSFSFSLINTPFFILFFCMLIFLFNSSHLSIFIFTQFFNKKHRELINIYQKKEEKEKIALRNLLRFSLYFLP